MAKNEPEIITVATMAGGLTPLVLRRYMPGQVTRFGIQEISDLLKEPGIDVGLLTGVPAVALAWFGKDGKGPVAYNEAAISTLAGFGGGALASTLGIAMFSLREEAEAAGFTLEPLSGSTRAGLELSRTKTTKEEETTGDNPAGVGLQTT